MAKKRDGERTGGDGGDLFRRAMADAAPLPRRRNAAPVAPAEPQPVAPPRRGAASPVSVVSTPAPSSQPASAPQPDDRLAGIDRRTAERLRRGRLAIEARLDLHGRFQEDAHRALNAFIVDCAAAGKRVVLVITGKGKASEGGGVLRRNVPRWLQLSPCAPHVLAAVPAQPQHGGAGALYVLLRRKRG
jgi:DNA-nicking Smr family endonuclease